MKLSFSFRRLIFFSANLTSTHLKRKVQVDVYVLSDWKNRFIHWPYRCLLINDGQDLRQMKFYSQVEQLFHLGKIQPMIIIGIHAANRLQEYGTINRPDYLGRGGKAKKYALFITKELFPFLRKNYSISNRIGGHSIAGFSLGGLSAFDLSWHYPELFGQTGVFSGSLWWRSSPFHEDDPDGDLIVQNYVKRSKKIPQQRYWFQAGTNDEESDRNGNGIIDAIDDTQLLMRTLREKGFTDMHYHEVEGGTHDPQTWGRVMPNFLQWLI